MATEFPKRWRGTHFCIEGAGGFKLKVDDGLFSIDAKGRLRLRIPASSALLLSALPAELSVRGEDDDGEVLTAMGCAVTNVRTHHPPTKPSTATLVIGRCVIEKTSLPPRWDERRIYLRGVKTYGRMTFLDRGSTVRFGGSANQDEDSAGSISADLTITPPAASDVWGDRLAHEYGMLISLAQRIPAHVPIEEFYSGGKVVRTVMQSTESAAWEGSNPLIPWWSPHTGRFLEQVLPAYRAEREAYQLDTLIWHYCRAHVQSYAELKFTSASVFMEAFKFFWAKNVGKIQQDLKANGLIRGFVRGTNAKGDNVLYTFEELLKLACAGINYETKFTFIEDRNALFHSGTATAAQRGVVNIWPQLRPELVRLYDQMDDMILRVLGYRGPIQTWSEPDATLAFTPDRTPLRQ